MDYKAAKYETILVDFDDGVLTLTFNLPDQRNPFTLDLMAEFRTVLNLLAVDPEVKVLVLTGAGSVFSAGGNVKEFGKEPEQRTIHHPLKRPLWNIPTLSAEERVQKQTMSGKRIFIELANLTKPTIAAINGTAAGAGFDASLACDLRYIADDAQFISSFVRIGIIPVDGGLWWLSRIVGLTKAYEIIYTGDPVTAQEAERISLVNKALPKAELMPFVMNLAKKLARGPSVSFQLSKHFMRKSLFMDFPEAIDQYYQMQEILFNTEDNKEGVRAFLEKRAPNFTGR